MKAPTPTVTSMILPISWLYGLGVRARNVLFKWGILHEQEFPLPVICIGNLTVGGTGKTPHTEYLIRLLEGHRIAVLSRGYGRKTRGYMLADAQSTAEQIGDEPYQIHQKFPGITVAVDENRVEGIQKLMTEINPDVILLDDAYQHRYVKAGLNILLTDYHRLMTRDCMLPAGRLREPLSGKERADIILITKCPELSEAECRSLREEMDLNENQHLFFSRIEYGKPTPVFPETETISWEELRDSQALLVAGIANPTPLYKEIEKKGVKVCLQEFRDHHTFSESELKKIEQKSQGHIILTTEKDAARLKGLPVSPSLKERLYQIPIHVAVYSDRKEDFNQIIINFVENK